MVGKRFQTKQQLGNKPTKARSRNLTTQQAVSKETDLEERFEKGEYIFK